MKQLKYFLLGFLMVIVTMFGVACNKKVEFDLTFIVDDAVYATVGTTGDEVIAMPNNPEKEGFEFDGWYWDKDVWKRPFTANSLLNEPLTANMSVYAKFEAEEDIKGTQIQMEGFEYIDSEDLGKAYTLTVANSKLQFEFNTVVTTNSKSTWTVSTDVYGNNTIASKTVLLSEGNNLYFLLVKDKDGNSQQYNVLIRRRPMYTVTYMPNLYTVHSTEEVEEGSYAVNIPTLTNTGKYFFMWSTDLTLPIMEDTTALAVWAANKYTITYDANGGTLSTKTQEVKYEDNFELATPSRNGYTFAGWYKDTQKVTNGKWYYLEDITLVAKWTANSNTIKYNLDGGTNHNSNPSSYTTGSTVTLQDATKTGYTFLGWTTSGIYTPTKYLEIKSTDYGEKTFTANWQANTYKITFDENNGVCSTTEKNATFGQYVSMPTATRDGYTFDGWYNNNKKYESGTWSVANNITLTAKWSIVKYNIKYTLNNGINNAQNPTQYTTEDTITLKDPTRTGYAFLGWTTETVITPTKGLQIVKGSIGEKSFTANWQANEYTITFDANLGACDISSKKVTFDSDFTLPTPTRIGYTFAGWKYNNQIISAGTWTTAQNCTFVATWTANTNTPYTVNHYLQNIENNEYTLDAPQNLTGTSDSTVSPSVKSYTGFTSPTKKTATVNPDGSLVVDYYYTRNSYTVSFVLNGGDSIASITQKYQSELSITNGEREGFTFGGWFTDKNLSTSYTDSIMPASNKTVYAWWAEENKPTDFTYSGTSTISISGYVGVSETIWVPSYIGDVSITKISSSAFQNQAAITNVVIPNTVTFIGSSAFYGCNAIENITLPFVGQSATASYYYESVFGYIFGYKNTSSAVSGTVTQYTTSYKYYIPTTIKTVTITNQTSIPAYAFENCNFIEKITIPENTADIKSKAFYNCSSLTDINIPENVVIAENAFDGSGLAAKSGVVYIGSILYKYNGTMPTGYTLNIKAGTTSIQANALSGCTGLSKVIFPDSLTKIGTNAFLNCSTLTELDIPNSVQTIEANAFKGCSKLTSVKVPFVGTSRMSTSAFSAIFGTVPSTLIEVEITDSSIIPANAFKGLTKLQNITVNEGVQSIGDYAFSGCTALEMFTIPSTVTTIGNYAFNGCTGLEEISISKNVEAIGGYAFNGCSRLSNVVFEAESKLATFGDYAFAGCVALTDIIIPDNVKAVANYQFKGCKALTTVKLSANTETIGLNAFQGCIALDNIVIPNRVSSIGNYAFDGCSGLKTLTIEGSSLNNIGAYAFQNCSVTETIVIPSSVETMGEYVFNGCATLTINCEVSAIPDGWDYNWNPSNCTVNWGV